MKISIEETIEGVETLLHYNVKLDLIEQALINQGFSPSKSKTIISWARQRIVVAPSINDVGEQ